MSELTKENSEGCLEVFKVIHNLYPGWSLKVKGELAKAIASLIESEKEKSEEIGFNAGREWNPKTVEVKVDKYTDYQDYINKKV